MSLAEPIASPPGPTHDESGEAVSAPTVPEWSPALRLAFRFIFSYLTLYNVTRLLIFPGGEKLAQIYYNLWQAVALWVGKHVLHLHRAMPVDPELGGDRTVDWVQLLAMVAFAALVTIVWTLVDRRSRNYRRLHDGLRLLVRYWLAFTMYNYGMIKIIQTQFIVLRFGRLPELYGDMSPMGLLWTFMSYSAGYNVFTGAAEAIGGILLFFRRTTLLGALMLMAVLSHVVLINFSYDVIVKIYSSNLLLMSVFLLAPDLCRLADLLVLHRPTTPAKAAPRWFDQGWQRFVRLGLKLIFIGYFLFTMTQTRLEFRRGLRERRAKMAARRLNTYDPKNFFLLKRGFHWINEYPVNR